MRTRLALLAAGASLLVALAALFSIHPAGRLWALSNGVDLSAPSRAAWLAAVPLLIALFLTAEFRGEELFAGTLGKRLSAWRLPPAAVWAAALALVPLLLVLRSRNHFLGDGWLLITLLENEGDAIPVRPGMGTILVGRTILKAGRLVHAGLGHEGAFALLAALCGGLYFVFVLRAAAALAGAWGNGRAAAGKLLLVAACLTTGGVQLYFGYVENYTLVSLFIFAFAAEGARFLLGDRRFPWWPTLLYLGAVFAHWGAFLLLPALALLWDRSLGTARRGPLRIWPELSWILFPVVSVALTFTGGWGMFTPVSITLGSRHYGVVSVAHLLNAANVALLTVPAGLLLLASAGGRRKGLPRQMGGALRFLRTCSLLLVGWGIVVRPFLGPRDWDLISLYAGPLTLWAAARFLTRARVREIAPAAAIVAGAGLFLLVPWVGGNRSVQGGAARVARWVVQDPNHLYGEKARITALAWVMAERGAVDASRYLIRKAVELAPEANTAAANMGILAWMDGDYGTARKYLREAEEKLDDNPPVHYYLAASYFHLREGDFGEAEFRKFLESNPKNPSARSYLGRICLVEDRPQEALDHFLVTYRAFPGDADLNAWIGRAYLMIGNRERAKYFLESAFRLDPEQGDAAAMLAGLEEGSGAADGDSAADGGEPRSKPKRTWVVPRQR